MELTLTKKIISTLGITAFTLILSGQIVQAQTTDYRDFKQSTSASDLNIESSNSPTFKITQGNFEIEPGTTTRSGSSYIGIGGNIGLSGDTSVGNGAFAVISKIGLTEYLSARPGALIEDDVTFLLPVTFDFSGDEVPNAEFSIAPYLGGGLAISTGEGDTLGLLISGGLDIPLSSQFTANAGANVTFINDTDVGLLLGVGYNF
ncbi:MAG: hypothetical protein ACFCU7_15835 [Pleurocapsa sp.]